jgi:formiminoglutamase
MPDPREDPNWPRASAWLSGEHLPDPVGSIGLIGAPLNCALTRGKFEQAPDAIRTILERYGTYDVDNDLDVRRLKLRDLGNLDVSKCTPDEALAPISKAIEKALGKDDAVVLLGGDNGISRPGCHGLLEPIENIGLITLDAHFDLRDIDDGLMNGNPVRALLADGLPGENIVQIGIQPFANSRPYAEVAKHSGIATFTADRVRRRGLGNVITEVLADLSQRVSGIYVDVDLDVLDRAFSPATNGSRPGGLAPWELRSAVRLFGLNGKVRVLDLVELDPEKDVADITVFTAASCLLSFASGVLSRKLGGG